MKKKPTLSHKPQPISQEKALGGGKRLIPIIFILLASILAFAVSFSITTFDNGLSSEQLNLTAGNITRTISIPAYAYVQNISLNLNTPELELISWWKFDYNTTFSNNLTVYDSEGSNDGSLNGYSFNHGIYPITTGGGTEVSNTHSETLDTTSSNTYFFGVNVTINETSTITKVKKHPSNTATRSYIYDKNGALVSNVSFSGDIATVSVNAPSGDYFLVMSGSDGADNQRVYASPTSYPYGSPHMIFTTGCYNDGALKPTSAYVYNIIEINTTISMGTNDYITQLTNETYGKNGKGIYFNGTDGFVNISQDKKLNEFSINLWVKSG